MGVMETHDVDTLFRQKIDAYVWQALQVDFLIDEIKFGLLRDIVEHCFGLRGFKMGRQKRAESILSVLFLRLVRDFCFEDFLKLVSKREQKTFLTDLLYQIYYINLTLENLVSKERLFFYLFQTLAVKASAKTIQAIFSSLSFTEKIRCLGFLLQQFDEGSFRIMQEAAHLDDDEIRRLLNLLERSNLEKQEFSQWALSQESFSREEVKGTLANIDEEIEQKAKKIAELLRLGLTREFSADEVKRALLVFGLFNHQVPKEAQFLHEYPALDEKLDAALSNLEKPGVKEFVDAVCEQIYTYNFAPERYLAGLKLITFAMPTAGKDLSQLFWLSSIVRAIDELHPHARVPIFIFDQSTPKLFKKNRAYLAKFRQVDIFQVGTEEILAIATKIGCREMLETGSAGRFGYGGARNAIFFIAPLFKYYYDKVGAKSLRTYVNSLSASELKLDWHELVLEEKRGPVIIHMGDDDVYIPRSTIYSDTLFSYEHAAEYFTRVGWFIGRRTTWTLSSFEIDYVLNRSPEILLQHNWDDSPAYHGMAGLLTKPKLCLNLPYGHEEAYLQAVNYYGFDFRLPSVHLSGYRFPKTELPKNRFAGLAELLLQHYRYLFSMLLVVDLVDPANMFKRRALPWNEHEPFHNLAEAISYMLLASTKEEMKRRFFKNLSLLAESYRQKSSKEEFATLNVVALLSQDITKATRPFKKLFRKEMKAFKELFELLAHDVSLLIELAETRVVKEKGLALTEACEKLLDVVGKGSFQDALANLSWR